MKNTNSLEEIKKAVFKHSKPIYEELSADSLLQKCLGDRVSALKEVTGTLTGKERDREEWRSENVDRLERLMTRQTDLLNQSVYSLRLVDTEKSYQEMRNDKTTRKKALEGREAELGRREEQLRREKEMWRREENETGVTKVFVNSGTDLVGQSATRQRSDPGAMRG